MTLAEVRAAVAETLRTGRFFVADGRIEIVHRPVVETSWELFRGHLLDEKQTRMRRSFEIWEVLVGNQREPLLSVLLDSAAGELHVTRSLLCYGFEPYETEPNVIETREVRAWRRELVATWDLDSFRDAHSLGRELSQGLLSAVVGTSRLPITSLESPLPAFSLGQVGYLAEAVGAPSDRPLSDPYELLKVGLAGASTPPANARLLEAVLRAADSADVPGLSEAFLSTCRETMSDDEIAGLFQTLFNHLALSPYTTLVDNLVRLLLHLASPQRLGPTQVVDIFGYMLRHLARHLTAFDLVTFHNRGANYPDALMLDAFFKAYLGLIDRHASLFLSPAGAALQESKRARLRRRALRQAWLLRSLCTGLPVPDMPTSPGENLLVLPPAFPRVPDEQLLYPARRQRRLFDSDSLEGSLSEIARHTLAAGMADLAEPLELRELGMAVFLDRPLGWFKQPGEVDRTSLLSYEAFSRDIALKRLERLAADNLLDGGQLAELTHRLVSLPVEGLPAARFDSPARPGVVALEDARQAAADFVFLRTTRQSLDHLLRQYRIPESPEVQADTLRWLAESSQVLLVRDPAGPQGTLVLTAYDRQMHPRLKLELGDTDNPPRYHLAGTAEYLLGVPQFMAALPCSDPPLSGPAP